MMKTGSIGMARTGSSVPNSKMMDSICLLLPLIFFVLWFFSLGSINVGQMNDLGLVSVMPPTMIAAFLLMTVSFCLTLQRSSRYKVPLLLFHIALMIFMLYGITMLVEQMPRFDIVYRHTGYTEFIQRTGTTNPNLDAYFSWPIFFSLAAFLNTSAGFSSILPYADWAPIAFAILYFAPLHMIFSAFTRDKRIIWLALWFFYLTNWIWQDYFSPQGFNFFLYLMMIAILVRWFKMPVDVPARPLAARLRRIPFATPFYNWLTAADTQQTPASPALRLLLLICFLLIFAFDVTSHQLTPMFTLLSVGGLIVCHRVRLWWLLIVMILMEVFWLFVGASTFMSGHMSMVFSGLHLFSSFNNNVSGRVAGNADHTFVAKLRVYMSVLIWGLAFVGALIRLLQKKLDASLAILAVMPFPLFIAQPYGGEMMLRSYMFSLPAMVFFVAALFYSSPVAAVQNLPIVKRFSLSFLRRPAWHSVALVAVNIILIAGFLFTRYGNENEDYITYSEFAGVNYLYSIAPGNSLFMTCWIGGPWQFKDYEKYTLDDLGTVDTTQKVIYPANVPGIVKVMRLKSSGANAYLIFTRSEVTRFDATSGLPAGSMLTLEHAVTASGDFTLIYKNSDVQIYALASSAQGGQ
ncbi:hypothetical protein [Dictyobacter arantiisoli]|uniref:Uncharacterized protein n=1 Tax=Dictyobacter arantiisoli TaxID=2014874 RepID=A0A5A5TFL9_9CHLR|nr:hypothetical protein [Dictyobacter arantiisoli]GCF10147.1 hypothetical protein KDI_37110 [Dictyobacter arantiisoli]